LIHKQSHEYLARRDIACFLEKDIGEHDHGLPELSYNMGRIRGIESIVLITNSDKATPSRNFERNGLEDESPLSVLIDCV